MVDFVNAKDCFPKHSVGGGVLYFLWNHNFEGPCEVVTVIGNERDSVTRYLNEFANFVRYNKAVSIIHKIENKGLANYSEIVSSRNPFGLSTAMRGSKTKKSKDDLVLVSSKGRGFISRSSIKPNDAIDKYKVMISRITYEHAGEPDESGKLRVLSRIELLKPGEVCTDSYLIIGAFNEEKQALSLMGQLKMQWTRFLIVQTLTSINLSKDKFCFVPQLPDNISSSLKSVYDYFGFTQDEIEFIEKIIKPME
jgi:site-specific DNA-methyltransferase (adenine-specific)